MTYARELSEIAAAITVDGSKNVSVAEKIVVTKDSTISGLTVGKGGGAVASNTSVGASALAGSNTGTGLNSAFGFQALQANTSGLANSAFGSRTLSVNTTGQLNTAIGDNALVANTTGSNNTAIGQSSLPQNTTGGNNTAIGQYALQANTTASYNTAVGYQAGYSNTTSISNTFVGTYAGYSSTGQNNTFFGTNAGYYVTSGAKNTVIGSYNGNQGGLDIRTASNYIVLSDGDGNPRLYCDNGGNFTFGTSGSLYLMPSTGGLARVGYITSSNAFQISYNSGSAGVQLSSGATSWGTFSDSRLKNVTGKYETPLADIAKLEPVKFTWKSDTENKPQVGVLAQSVQSVVPEAVELTTASKDDETTYLAVRYTELIPLMISAIQELKAELDATKAEVAALKTGA